MNFKNIKLIIRGFIYKENWTPISVRRRKIRNYTIDFFQCKDGYIDLINKLKEKYNVSVYFSTYNTTPIHLLKKLQKEFKPEYIFISPEQGSTQFTTTNYALSRLADNVQNDELTLIIRSDLIIKLKLIELIYNFDFLHENKLYVLTKERDRNRVIDIMHIFPKNIYESFSRYISRPKLRHAHLIQKEIPCVEMSQENLCGNTTDCEVFYRIYQPSNRPVHEPIKIDKHSVDLEAPHELQVLDKAVKIIYVDIDNTITNTIGTDYANASPISKSINIINNLYKKGHTIIYWTARGSGSGIDYQELTLNQLKSWGCLYNEVKFNKPVYDLFIDDKAISNIESVKGSQLC